MKLKAKVELSGKAGSFTPGQTFETDSSYGEFLVNMKFAEVVKETPLELEEKKGAKKDEGHK